jgi:hypothetical protein
VRKWARVYGWENDDDIVIDYRELVKNFFEW